MFLCFPFFLLIYSCLVNSVRSRCSSIDWGCRKINYSNSSVYSRLSPFGQLDRYYGHHAIGDKSQSPCETHKEITEINSRHYGVSLCEHFHAPKRNILLIFSSRYSGHLVPNPGSHNTERHYDEGKQRTDFSIGCELENFLLMVVSFFRIVRNLMLAQ